MTKLLDDVARAIDEAFVYEGNNWEPEARAALTVFAGWLREPSEGLLIALCGPGYKDCEEAERNLLRALADHLEKEMG